jgi:hypothetical protein
MDIFDLDNEAFPEYIILEVAFIFTVFTLFKRGYSYDCL